MREPWIFEDFAGDVLTVRPSARDDDEPAAVVEINDGDTVEIPPDRVAAAAAALFESAGLPVPEVLAQMAESPVSQP